MEMLEQCQLLLCWGCRKIMRCDGDDGRRPGRKNHDPPPDWKQAVSEEIPNGEKKQFTEVAIYWTASRSHDTWVWGTARTQKERPKKWAGLLVLVLVLEQLHVDTLSPLVCSAGPSPASPPAFSRQPRDGGGASPRIWTRLSEGGGRGETRDKWAGFLLQRGDFDL